MSSLLTVKIHVFQNLSQLKAAKNKNVTMYDYHICWHKCRWFNLHLKKALSLVSYWCLDIIISTMWEMQRRQKGHCFRGLLKESVYLQYWGQKEQRGEWLVNQSWRISLLSGELSNFSIKHGRLRNNKVTGAPTSQKVLPWCSIHPSIF